MKMKQAEVANLVREFAKKAGYERVTVEHIEPDEPSKKWIAEISAITPAFTKEYVQKIFMVDDDTQDVSFKRSSSEELKGPSTTYKVQEEKEGKESSSTPL